MLVRARAGLQRHRVCSVLRLARMPWESIEGRHAEASLKRKALWVKTASVDMMVEVRMLAVVSVASCGRVRPAQKMDVKATLAAVKVKVECAVARRVRRLQVALVQPRHARLMVACGRGRGWLIWRQM